MAHPLRSRSLTALALRFALVLLGCKPEATIELPPLPPRTTDAGALAFTCSEPDAVRCDGNVHLSCKPVDEFLEVVEVDCSAQSKICSRERVCITCSPGSMRCQPCAPGDLDCDPQRVQRCDDDGDRWLDVETCDLPAGDGCFEGECRNMCQQARDDRSYVGCEFYAVDLDNAALDDLNNAAAQQFAVAVANPQDIPVDVTVELNDAEQAEPLAVRVLDQVTVPPGGLEVFALPQREVDGSSAAGLNDGTHTALSSRAFRVSSSHPITAYQFNPLENVNVFSNDASLLLPTSAVGTRYTVVGWPQTIGDSSDPNQDFDSTSSDEDLRAFLTIVGTEPSTTVRITFGDLVVRVVGAGPVPRSGRGDMIELTLGPYDVLNLETEGFNADFTGSRIEATAPVVVFVGSEASDVPTFGTYATRQCCADHLEEQLLPDSALGSQFVIARMPPRTAALAAAAPAGQSLDIAQADEPEWVRVVAASPQLTKVRTTLPAPDDAFELAQGEARTLRIDRDCELSADRPVAVLQALPSQGVTGIPRQYPGGDPSIIAVPPVQQYRQSYIFLTPDKYAFDFVVITAEADTRIVLDGAELPDTCTTEPLEGLASDEGVTAARVIHRCQLSFPIVTPGPTGGLEPGEQNDGVHTIVASREVGIVVYGFDRFVSYAYVGGLDLDVLN